MERNGEAVKNIEFIPYNIHHINIYVLFWSFFIMN